MMISSPRPNPKPEPDPPSSQPKHPLPTETIDCGLYIDTHNAFDYSAESIQELSMYKCKLCPRTVFNKSSIITHIEMIHPSTTPMPEPEPPDPNIQET